MGKSQRVNPTIRRTQIPNQIPFYYSVAEDLRKKIKLSQHSVSPTTFILYPTKTVTSPHISDCKKEKYLPAWLHER